MTDNDQDEHNAWLVLMATNPAQAAAAAAELRRRNRELEEEMNVVLRAGPSTALAHNIYNRAKRAEAKLADAWDEGYEVGKSDMSSGLGYVPEPTPNPYRAPKALKPALCICGHTRADHESENGESYCLHIDFSGNCPCTSWEQVP